MDFYYILHAMLHIINLRDSIMMLSHTHRLFYIKNNHKITLTTPLNTIVNYKIDQLLWQQYIAHVLYINAAGVIESVSTIYRLQLKI